MIKSQRDEEDWLAQQEDPEQLDSKYEGMMIDQSEHNSQDDSYNRVCSQIDYSVYEKSQSAYRSRQVSYQHNNSTKDLYAIWEQNMVQHKQQKKDSLGLISCNSQSNFNETKQLAVSIDCIKSLISRHAHDPSFQSSIKNCIEQLTALQDGCYQELNSAASRFQKTVSDDLSQSNNAPKKQLTDSAGSKHRKSKSHFDG